MKNWFIVIILGIGLFLVGCQDQEQTVAKENSSIGLSKVKEDENFTNPSEDELEYYAHIHAITTVMKEDIDLFYQVNEEAGHHPSAMQTDSWWENLSSALIGLKVSVEKYETKNLPANGQIQKDIHDLIIKANDLLLYVSNHFGEALVNKDIDEVNICFSKMREANDYLDKVIDLNEHQLENWKRG